MDWSLLKKKIFLFYFYSNLTDVENIDFGTLSRFKRTIKRVRFNKI